MACMNNLNVLYALKGILALGVVVLIYFMMGAFSALLVTLFVVLVAIDSITEQINKVKNESQAKNLHD